MKVNLSNIKKIIKRLGNSFKIDSKNPRTKIYDGSWKKEFNNFELCVVYNKDKKTIKEAYLRRK